MNKHCILVVIEHRRVVIIIMLLYFYHGFLINDPGERCNERIEFCPKNNTKCKNGDCIEESTNSFGYKCICHTGKF